MNQFCHKYLAYLLSLPSLAGQACRIYYLKPTSVPDLSDTGWEFAADIPAADIAETQDIGNLVINGRTIEPPNPPPGAGTVPDSGVDTKAFAVFVAWDGSAATSRILLISDPPDVAPDSNPDDPIFDPSGIATLQ